ncbi:MAG: hypothetical protein NZ823_17510 [Blastocatellia bacterium]|nr:hypothetical protein [Blastocatellia bacterium]
MIEIVSSLVSLSRQSSLETVPEGRISDSVNASQRLIRFSARSVGAIAATFI